MSAVIRVAVVMVTAGIFCGLLAGVVVAAFGWPLFVAAMLAGAGAGAAGVLVYQRMRAAGATRRAPE